LKRAHKQLLIAILLAIGIGVTGIFFVRIQYPSDTFQLAQIMTIEAELLSDWQQTQGIDQDLSRGDSGWQVRVLQRLLSQDSDIYPEQMVTGYFGKRTKRAVERFQREYDISPTGYVGPITRKQIHEVLLSHLCPSSDKHRPDYTLRKVTPSSPLPENYIPNTLQDISDKVPTTGTICLRSDVIPHLEDMMEAAREDGIELTVTSGYRKPEIQQYLLLYWLDRDGGKAFDEVASPGESEHQLGTVVDLTAEGVDNDPVSPDFGDSAAGKWMKKNAYRYGFIMSYPKNKESETGYAHEPWHWRYVGKDIAKQVAESEKAFTEFNVKKAR